MQDLIIKKMKKSYIDIGKWWLHDGLGKPMSVNAIYESLKGTENEVSRYTLTKAKNGELEGADISTIESLIRICSEWSGKKLSFNDLIASNQKEKANFNLAIA